MHLLKLINGIKLPDDIILLISEYLGYFKKEGYGHIRLCYFDNLLMSYKGNIISKIPISVKNESYYSFDLKKLHNEKPLPLSNIHRTLIIDKNNLLKKDKNLVSIMNDETVHTHLGIYQLKV
jgi:hypothetical protein